MATLEALPLRGGKLCSYSQSLVRSLGLPTARVDRDFLERSLADIRSLLEGQIDFHKTTVMRSETIEHKLHWAEVRLFGATLACCLLHIIGEVGYMTNRGE